VGQAADHRAEADDTGGDDHHGGIDGVAGQRRHAGAAGDEQREEQGRFDHGHGKGEHGSEERCNAAHEQPGLLTDDGGEHE
jgi:hypothetical protein